MRVLVAFDKFKDALTAREAVESAAGALRLKHPDWELDLCPLTDGGEGFCETLTAAAKGEIKRKMVRGPRSEIIEAPLGYVAGCNLASPVRRQLGLSPDGTLAVLDMASASGLAHLSGAGRDPWLTTSAGTGELLLAAAVDRADAILLGVGGSATNDLGFGALATLGFRFRDAAGKAVTSPTPASWPTIARIDRSGAGKLPPLFIACDVTHPLLGPQGATFTFGPQKGLRPGDTARLDLLAARMAALLCEACNQPLAVADTPGAGAAGGIAFGLMVASGAKLVPGFDLVSDWLGLPERIAAADLVLTGEGRFDATSLGGKGPGSILRAARRLNKTAHVFAGSVETTADATCHAITPAGLSLAQALPRSAELLASAVAGAF